MKKREQKDERNQSANSEQQAELLSLLNTPLSRLPVKPGYMVGLFVVGLAMLLLPILYLGLIALFAHAIWWNWVYIQSVPVGVLAFWNYVAIVVAGITLLFMIKPFLGFRWGKLRPVRLKRETHPFLFDYVEKLCDCVGSPYPTSIRVDCVPNASASLRHGLWSLFTNDLILTIGLPLAAGMNVRQLTGVLAHEFGHFSQGFGMRFSLITLSISHWLSFAAWQRDYWDYRLAQMAKNTDIRLSLLLWFTQFCIWLSRKFVAAICLLGHGISFFLLRQMEFDADRYEIRVVGSETFQSSTEQLGLIGIGHQKSLSDLQQLYEQERLADNFPKFVASTIPQIPTQILEKLKKHREEEQSAWHYTHPPDRERIERAQKLNDPGLIPLDAAVAKLPASILFGDFEKLCQSGTVRYYEEMIGKAFRKETLRDTNQLIQERDVDFEASRALDRYFQVHIPIQRPLQLDDDIASRPQKPNEVLEQLKLCRNKMLTLVDEYEKTSQCLEAAEEAWALASQAFILQSVNMRFRPDEFRVASSDKQDVKDRLKQTSEAVKTLKMKMHPFEEAAEARISAALKLVNVPELIHKIGDGETLRQEVHALLPTLKLLSSLMRETPDLILSHRKLGALLSRLNKHSTNEMVDSIKIQMRDMYNVLNNMKKKMGNHLFPTAYGEKAFTIQEYALPQLPEPDDLFPLFFMAEYSCTRLMKLQIRLFSKLTYYAEKVETFVRLPQLEVRETTTT